MINIKLFLTAFVCLISSSILLSQSAYVRSQDAKTSGFKIKAIDLNLSMEADFIKDMDADYFLNQIPDVQKSRVDDLNFQPNEVVSMACENPSINLGLTLVNTRFKNIEWRNAFAFKPNRIDNITYRNSSNVRGNYIMIHGNHTEFTLESALLYKLSGFDTFILYGGIGTNLGITTNNRIHVNTAMDLTAPDTSYSDSLQEDQNFLNRYSEKFNTGSQLNQRIFLQSGFGIKFFQRIEIGLDVKYGYGYRADLFDSINRTHIVAFNLNSRYIL